jgi:hypothetical protein
MKTIIDTPQGKAMGYTRDEPRPELPEGYVWSDVTLTRKNTPGQVYFFAEKVSIAQARDEKIAASDRSHAETLKQRQDAYQRAKEAGFPDQPVPADGAAPGAQGLGQTSDDLARQIQPYKDIPWTGSEKAVIQHGWQATAWVGKRLPKEVPGRYRFNEASSDTLGQECKLKDGDVKIPTFANPLGFIEDLIPKKWGGVSVGPKTCINVPALIKKTAGGGADAMRKLVEPLGNEANQGFTDKMKAGGG